MANRKGVNRQKQKMTLKPETTSDYWNVDVSRSLSDSSQGFTKFIKLVCCSQDFCCSCFPCVQGALTFRAPVVFWFPARLLVKIVLRCTQAYFQRSYYFSVRFLCVSRQWVQRPADIPILITRLQTPSPLPQQWPLSLRLTQTVPTLQPTKA